MELISCTGANLEEDLFRLMASDRYEEVDWRTQTPAMDADLAERGMNRITDVAVPEDVIREVEDLLLTLWHEAGGGWASTFSGVLSEVRGDGPEPDPLEDLGARCVLAVRIGRSRDPGRGTWVEDSTMGNIFANQTDGWDPERCGDRSIRGRGDGGLDPVVSGARIGQSDSSSLAAASQVTSPSASYL